MQKGGEGVQIACNIAYVLNGRPLEMSVYMIIRDTSKVIDKKNNEDVVVERHLLVTNQTVDGGSPDVACQIKNESPLSHVTFGPSNPPVACH